VGCDTVTEPYIFPSKQEWKETEVRISADLKVNVFYVQCPCGKKIFLNDFISIVMTSMEEAIGKMLCGEDCNAWEVLSKNLSKEVD